MADKKANNKKRNNNMDDDFNPKFRKAKNGLNR